MKTLKVRKVSTPKLQSGGRIVVLHLSNGMPNILRTEEQFVNDLQGSFLIGDNVKSFNHPEVRNVLSDLKNFTVTGEIIHRKKGELYTLTEHSRMIKDPSHPAFGTVAIGDKVPVETDSSTVTDGFLDITLNPMVVMQNKQAFAYGAVLASTFGNVDEGNYSSDAADVESFDASAIPDDVYQEAMSEDIFNEVAAPETEDASALEPVTTEEGQ